MTQTVYEYHIDLNERGYFYAHVDNSDGNTIFELSNEEIDIDGDGESSVYYGGELWTVECGFMKHYEDVDGLKNYLVSMGIMKENYSLVFTG